MTLQELGQSIREKREAAGISIDDVAARIKISARILRSIEEGSLVGLPHAVYTKSFTRSFGLLVGYDPDELNAALEQAFPPEMLDETRIEPVLNKNASMSYPGTGRRIIALLALLIVLGGIGAGIWYVTVNYGSQIVDLVKKPFSAISPSPGEGEQESPARSGNANATSAVDNALSLLMNAASAKQAPASPTPPPWADSRPESASSSTAVASLSPAQAGVDASDAGRPSVSVPGAGEVSSFPPDGSPVGLSFEAPAAPQQSGSGKNQVLISATEACWVSSRADGARGRDYTLQAKESFVLTYTDNLEITLGNAGGVRIEHNGRSLGAPGGRGQRVVLRFPSAAR